MFNSEPLPLGSSNAHSCEQWFAFPNLTMVTYIGVYVRLSCRVVWWTYGGGVVWCRSMWCDVVWFGVHTVVWCGSVVNHCHRQEVTPLVSPLHELPSSVSYKWRILSFDIAQCTLTPSFLLNYLDSSTRKLAKGVFLANQAFCWWFCQQDSGFVHKVR